MDAGHLVATQELASEEIYDALIDDELFAQLSVRLSQALGARSCTIHWWEGNQTTQIMSHSGYFSDDQITDYATNFAQHDLWSVRGSQPHRSNQVWNCDEIVPPGELERGPFYNEWIRGMGDDTFHCMGIAMRTQWGFGMIGLHRGRSQPRFSDQQIRAFTGKVPALRQVLTMRGRFIQAAGQYRDIECLLGALGQPIFLVAPTGRLLHANYAAERLLNRADGLLVNNGILSARVRKCDRALREGIVGAAGRVGIQASAVAILRETGDQLDLSLMPLASSSGARNVLIIASEADRRDQSAASRLRALYGLSAREAALAEELAAGSTPAEVADRGQVSIHTVRVQIKAVAAKLGCHRQSDIVRIVRSLPCFVDRFTDSSRSPPPRAAESVVP